MGMVNINEKPTVKRYAEAKGRILLRPDTIEKIKKGKIEKGNPLAVAEIAGINAAKQTHFLIPYCHQIPLSYVKIDFFLKDDGIEAVCSVMAEAKTGVEMEAIVGVSMALNSIWDMVKYLEKDEYGQYPYTRIEAIQVTKKEKRGESEI